MENEAMLVRQLRVDDLRHEDDVEFWYARELMGLLGHTSWKNFEKSVGRAKESLNGSKMAAKRCFNEVTKSSIKHKGGHRIGQNRVDDGE